MVRYDIAMPTPVDIIEDNPALTILVVVVVIAAIVGLVFIKKARKKVK